MSEEELERKLRAFFKQEVEGVMPPPEWWDAALANLGEQEQPRSKWWLRLPAFPLRLPRLAPMPLAAASLALVVGLSAIAALVMGPALWGSEDESQWLGSSGEAPSAPVPASPQLGAESGSAVVRNMAAGDTGPLRVSLQASVSSHEASDFEADGGIGFGSGRSPFIRIDFFAEASACEAADALDILSNSEFAFDGSVELGSVESSGQVLFSVNRWYRGGDSQTVLTEVEPGPSFITPILDGRWLVAGQGGDSEPEACGLLQRYSDERAQAWEAALAP